MSHEWIECRTPRRLDSCQPPFSFYRNVIDQYWKSPTHHTTRVALNRFCTLARKMDAKTLLFDCVLHRRDIRDEITGIDNLRGPGGLAEAVSITFFSEPLTADDFSLCSEESLLGQVILVNYTAPESISNYTLTYIFEAIFRLPQLPATNAFPKRRDLLNNYIHSYREFDVHVADRVYSIPAVYFCQQNQVTSRCCHACLRMALNTVAKANVSTQFINEQLGLEAPHDGMFTEEIYEGLGLGGLRTVKFDNHPVYGIIPHLYSIIESGYPALLFIERVKGARDLYEDMQVVTDGEEHVLYVFGHTFNSDEWHPQALSHYAGPESSPYYASSLWADHFIIHDDNLGPYYCLDSNVLSRHPKVNIPRVVGIIPKDWGILPNIAEAIAANFFNSIRNEIGDKGNGPWCTYIASGKDRFVFRTFLSDRKEYLAHLAASVGHDGSRMTEAEIRPLERLPGRFWVSEFSLPNVFTGNRNKFGEILVGVDGKFEENDVLKGNVDKMYEHVLAMRAPSLTITTCDQKNIFEHSLLSHSPIFRRLSRSDEW